MKKIASIAPVATLALLTLMACSRVEPDGPGTDLPLVVEAGIGEPTRATVLGNLEKFDEGDQIALYVWTGGDKNEPAGFVVEGVVNTLQSDNTWTPATKMYWKDASTAHYFLSVFPARSISNFKADSFTLDPADYEASDLLVATGLNGLVASNVPVKLNFKHMMAKLQLNLSYSNEWDIAPTGTTATATAATSCTVDYMAGSVVPGEPGTVALTKLSQAAAGSAESYSAILIPQSNFRTVTMVVGGKAYVYTHPSDIALRSGKTTVLNLTVGRDKIELASDISILDWTTGPTVNGDALE